jgi:hypothetical protein
MILFIALVIGLVVVLLPQLQSAFEANRVLNGVILAVLVIGILNNLRQVLRLNPEVTWIEQYRSGDVASADRQPKLLSPMATMLGERRGGRISLSAPAMRSILDSIASRLEESREISRYAIGLLVVLGLLGTFWGLLETVGSVSDVISNLSVAGGDVTVFFDDLKRGLEAPLSGMGTAFSSSLFGLAGSLVLGFLDLQAGQAQNRFYNDLEEWLSTVTRLGSGGFSGGEGEGPSNVPAYMQALMEQMADNMEHLRRSIELSEESRMTGNVNIMALTESVNSMTDQMRAEQSVLLRLAESQKEIRNLLGNIAEGGGMGGGMDDRTKGHIRNMDAHMARLVEDSATGRERTISELRSEIKLLARTMAAIAESQQQQRSGD